MFSWSRVTSIDYVTAWLCVLCEFSAQRRQGPQSTQRWFCGSPAEPLYLWCMALIELAHQENARGDFFVDTTCIDCDLCRQIAPDTFSDIGDQSIVYHQPDAPAQEFDALKALVTCPTASIGTI